MFAAPYPSNASELIHQFRTRLRSYGEGNGRWWVRGDGIASPLTGKTMPSTSWPCGAGEASQPTLYSFCSHLSSPPSSAISLCPSCPSAGERSPLSVGGRYRPTRSRAPARARARAPPQCVGERRCRRGPRPCGWCHRHSGARTRKQTGSRRKSSPSSSST